MVTTSVIITTTPDRWIDLNRCVKALLCQRLRPNEIIIVVDGSSGSGCTNSNFLLEDSVSIIDNFERLGSNPSRNIGIRKATGQLLFFCDDDDYFHTDKIFRAVEDFIRSRYDFAYGVSEVFVVDTKIRYLTKPPEDIFLNHAFQKNIFGATSNFVVSSKFINDHSCYFDEELLALQDWDFALSFLLKGASFFYLKKSLTYYQVNISNKSISKSVMKHNNAHKYISKKYLTQINQLSNDSKKQRSINNSKIVIYKLLLSGQNIDAFFNSLISLYKYHKADFFIYLTASFFGLKFLFRLKMFLSKVSK